MQFARILCLILCSSFVNTCRFFSKIKHSRVTKKAHISIWFDLCRSIFTSLFTFVGHAYTSRCRDVCTLPCVFNENRLLVKTRKYSWRRLQNTEMRNRYKIQRQWCEYRCYLMWRCGYNSVQVCACRFKMLSCVSVFPGTLTTTDGPCLAVCCTERFEGWPSYIWKTSAKLKLSRISVALSVYTLSPIMVSVRLYCSSCCRRICGTLRSPVRYDLTINVKTF